jgi:hypothetical protein
MFLLYVHISLGADLTQRAAELEPAVAALRGWSWQKPVEKATENVEQLRAKLSEEEENPQQQAMLQLLGLLPAGMDLKKTAEELLSDQVGGYYDPEVQRLVLVEREGMQSNLMSDLLLVHELGHALDDQYFDLEEFMEGGKSLDESTARRSMVEGSASAVMMGWMLKGIQTGDFGMKELTEAMSDASQYDGASLRRAPTWMRGELLVPYVGGTTWFSYKKSIMNLSAQDWLAERVLQAAKDPPQSTEQILHPEKYWEQRDLPVQLVLTGQDQLPQETFGELACMAMVDPKGKYLSKLNFVSTPTLPACSGWGGDRFYLESEKRGLWISTWESPADRDEFVKALGKKSALRLPLGQRSLVLFPGYSKEEAEARLGTLQVVATVGGAEWGL